MVDWISSRRKCNFSLSIDDQRICRLLTSSTTANDSKTTSRPCRIRVRGRRWRQVDCKRVMINCALTMGVPDYANPISNATSSCLCLKDIWSSDSSAIVCFALEPRTWLRCSSVHLPEQSGTHLKSHRDRSRCSKVWKLAAYP